MKRRHRILDHPILGYFLLLIFTSIILSLGGALDTFIADVLPGYGKEYTMMGSTIKTASGVGIAIGALAAAGVFYLWFRPGYKGILKTEGLKAGLIMLLPCLVIHWAGSVVSWITFGTGNVLMAFLWALAPGFGEEVMFRGLGVANYMRTIKSEKQITTIFMLSSIIFGVAHMSNALAGGDLTSVIYQSVYAIFIGMLLGAVYLRTGTLWPVILGHFSLDFMEFIRSDLNDSAGLMTGMGIGDWITIAASVVALFLSRRLMNKKYYPEIMQLWAEKWNRTEDSQPDEI